MDRLFSATMWLVLFIYFTSFIDISVCASRVELVNNEYVNLVVAITEAAPVNQSNQIIDNIKKIIGDASPILHQATHDRAIFKNVTIIIPQSWDHINTLTATWETVEDADILIDAPNPKFGNTPFTLQSDECGKPGKRIHLTPNYVATINLSQNLNDFGKPGKVFVHEWAHYRYGVFNEYGTPNDPKFPLFYRSPKDSIIVPNICSDLPLNGMFDLLDNSNNSTNCQIDATTQLYDKNCQFSFKNNFNPTSSLSSWHQIDSVVHFCDDHTHNPDLPNMQNLKCNKQSVWSIIEKHRDFANGSNSQGTDFEQAPSIDFRIVKIAKTSPRFVLVTDVSMSMSNFSRIDKLGEAVRAWVMNDVPKGSKVGMIKFSSKAFIVSNLTKITEVVSRKKLTDSIPKDLIGATCIGCGLEMALKMLREESNETGGVIVLVTDGKNTEGRTSIDDVSGDVKASNVRVVTIAFGPEADSNLENLADLTGGKSYYIRDENTNGQAIRDAFLGALTYQSTISNSDLEFKLLEKQITKSENFQFYVDRSVGRNLKLSIYDLPEFINLMIKLTGPDGQVIELKKSNSNTTVEVINVVVAEAGRWKSEVEFDNVLTKPATVVVTTQLLENAAIPITTRCWIPNANVANASSDPVVVHAEVMRGAHPVIRANVKAYIVKPDGEVDILDLFDDGNIPDGNQNDGEYSRYFTNTTQKGRYTIQCQIINSGTALQSDGFIGSASPRFSNYPEHFFENVPLENFSRVALGGSFQVRTPVPMDDPYPPGDVRDLSVSLVNQSPTNVSVELQWTAPGDDLDSGIVSFYEFKYSDDETDLIDSNFDESSFDRQSRSVIMTDQDLIAGSLLPNQAGTPQSATFLLVNVPRGKNCYVALRAVDKSHKVSHVSNFGVFFITNDQDSTDMILIVSNNESAGAHVVSVMVAGLGLILVGSFSILLLTSLFRGITSKSKFYSVVPNDAKSPV